LKHGGSANAVFSTKNQILTYQKTLADKTKEDLENEKAQGDVIAQHIDNVKAMPPEKQAQGFSDAVQDLVNRGYLQPQQAQGLQYQGPDQLDTLEKTFLGHNAVIEQNLKQQQTTTSAAEGEKAQLEANALKQFGGMTGPMIEARYLSIQQAKNTGKPVTADDQAFAKAYERNKTLVPQFNLNMQGSLLDQQALNLAAQNYLQTGQMPQGMRSPGMSASIIRQAGNLAAQNPDMANLAANRASYEANTHSLQSLQKNVDQVTAFENTAGKNLDQFISTAKKVVDSGSPWINKPLRAIDQGALGSADLAAYNAARQTAVNEIAKVLNSSNATGVTSDAARNEVNSLIGPDATLAQVYSASKILRQDMENRRISYGHQIDDIKGRLGTPQQQTQQGQPSAQSYAGQRMSRANLAKAAQANNMSEADLEKQFTNGGGQVY
jgi:hypothetical protein